MEQEPTEGVVDKAVAYVKDMMGLPGSGTPRHDHVKPAAIPLPDQDIACEESTGAYPREKGAMELDAESARREDGE